MLEKIVNIKPEEKYLCEVFLIDLNGNEKYLYTMKADSIEKAEQHLKEEYPVETIKIRVYTPEEFAEFNKLHVTPWNIAWYILRIILVIMFFPLSLLFFSRTDGSIWRIPRSKRMKTGWDY